MNAKTKKSVKAQERKLLFGYDKSALFGEVEPARPRATAYNTHLKSSKGYMKAACACFPKQTHKGACAGHHALSISREMILTGLLTQLDELVGEIEQISSRTDFSENPDMAKALGQLFKLRKSSETK